MSLTDWMLAIVAVYLGVNFVCALALHWHADHQAHLPLRFLDVLVHFVLITAFGLPVLLVITAEALFGGKDKPTLPKTGVARAA